jgi:SAM-dependent methyltransferase
MKNDYTGEQATKYVARAGELYSWKYIEKPCLEKHLRAFVHPETRVLDLGCGAGRSLEIVEELGGGAKNFVGVDLSSDLIAVAKESFPDAEFVVADLNVLSFPPEHFELIVSNMVLHYFTAQQLATLMKQCFSWLAPGGSLVFIATHPLRFPEDHGRYFSGEKKHVSDTPWGTAIEFYLKTFSDYVNAVLGAGFELILVDEPRAIAEGKLADPKDFARYDSQPTRFAVVARKP